MTDLEISKALALAIGWPKGRVNILGVPKQVWVQEIPRLAWSIRVFDYRDWRTIGPIAERYDMFPYKSHDGTWEVNNADDYAHADTPQKAIALAVIEGMRK